jgi:hypothetical protein
MKATRHNQARARRYAERHDGGFDQRAREIRAENERRAAAATGRLRVVETDYTWLMQDVCSTPYAVTRS